MRNGMGSYVLTLLSSALKETTSLYRLLVAFLGFHDNYYVNCDRTIEKDRWRAIKSSAGRWSRDIIRMP